MFIDQIASASWDRAEHWRRRGACARQDPFCTFTPEECDRREAAANFDAGVAVDIAMDLRRAFGFDDIPF